MDRGEFSAAVPECSGLRSCERAVLSIQGYRLRGAIAHPHMTTESTVYAFNSNFRITKMRTGFVHHLQKGPAYGYAHQPGTYEMELISSKAT